VTGKKSPRKKSSGRKYGEGHITVRLTKAGVPRYAARWYEPVPGDKPRLAIETFGTMDEAEDHLRAVARAKRDGRYVSTSTLTVQQLIDDHLQRNKTGWKGATYATYRQRAYTHIIPALGTLKVVELTPARLQSWVDGLVRSGKVAPKTVEESKRVISAALNAAVRLDIIRSNPASAVRIPSQGATTHNTWTELEVAKVLAAVADDPMYHAVYRVILLTGMRPGELRALQWPDIDFDQHVISVRRTITRNGDNQDVVGTTTKTGRHRAVAIPESTVHALRQWKAAQARIQLAAETWEDAHFVFTNRTGGFLSLNTWRKHHEAIIRQTGVGRITLHECRHTVATRLMGRNTHPLIVSRLLGHSKISTTLDMYSHPDESLLRSAIDALETTFDMEVDENG